MKTEQKDTYRKYLPWFALVFLLSSVVSGLNAYVEKPETQKELGNLKIQVDSLISEVTHLNQTIFRKDLIIQRKDKENARLRIKSNFIPIKKEVAKPLPHVITVERQLTHQDSSKIVDVMIGEKMTEIDSLMIYRGYLEGHMVKGKSGVKLYNGK